MSATMLPPQKQKQAVDSDAVERLGGELAALVGADWHRRDYGVAVSGGPDSMAGPGGNGRSRIAQRFGRRGAHGRCLLRA
jgi:hypothetical protein